MVSAITNDGVDAAKTSAILDKIDGFVKEAGQRRFPRASDCGRALLPAMADPRSDAEHVMKVVGGGCLCGRRELSGA